MHLPRFTQVVEFYVRKYGDDGTFAFDDVVNSRAMDAKQGTSQPAKNYNLPTITQNKNMGLDSLMADLGNFSHSNPPLVCITITSK